MIEAGSFIKDLTKSISNDIMTLMTISFEKDIIGLLKNTETLIEELLNSKLSLE